MILKGINLMVGNTSPLLLTIHFTINSDAFEPQSSAKPLKVIILIN